jgi:hypothetical protein
MPAATVLLVASSKLLANAMAGWRMMTREQGGQIVETTGGRYRG